MTMLANYRKEREAFEKLLDCDSCRVLLLCGKSGMGKTTLLDTFKELSEAKGVCCVLFDCKGTVVLDEVFGRISNFLGQNNLPNLTKSRSASENPTINISVTGNFLCGMWNNLLITVLPKYNPVKRQAHCVQLMDVLTEDLKNLERPLLVLFDTYEKMNSDVKLWTELFLARICLFPQVRVVIAGQQIPKFDKGGVKKFAQHFELTGVSSAEDWLPYLQFKQRTTGNLDNQEFLKVICSSYQGHPKDIAKLIDGLSTMGELA